VSEQVTEDLLDFRNWLFMVWQHLNLPHPTPVQYDIAHWLQHGPKRLITEAFRGVGKSFVTAAFVTWCLLLNPQLKFLVVSASKDRADAFSIFVKRLIAEMPELAHLKPKPGQRDSNLSFDVGPAENDQSPSVKSVGITGQLTGSRADVIIADDVESLNNSATNDQRLKLGERIKEFDAVLKPGGRIVYLGTPQTEFSIYNELEKRGYVTRIWPARYPDDKRRTFYGERLAPMLVELLDRGAPVGGTTDPKRFSDLDLAEREASYGKSGFALQFMLDTSLADQDRYPLKLSDLVVMACNPELAPARTVWATSPDLAWELPAVGLQGDRFYRPMDVQKPWTPYTGCVMAIDPSGRGKDETGFAVVKIANGMLFLVASGGFQGGYEPDTLKALAMVALAHKVKEVVIEDNFGDGMFTELFKPVLNRVWPCGVTGERSVGQKERRIIDTLEPVLNQHRLVVDEKVARGDFREDADHRKSLFYQLTRITRDKGALAHDDRVEALSMAIAYWSESMARDVERAADDARQAEIDQQLQDFMDGIDLMGTWKGQKPAQERTWLALR
jgi:hypothetical protein